MVGDDRRDEIGVVEHGGQHVRRDRSERIVGRREHGQRVAIVQRVAELGSVDHVGERRQAIGAGLRLGGEQAGPRVGAQVAGVLGESEMKNSGLPVASTA